MVSWTIQRGSIPFDQIACLIPSFLPVTQSRYLLKTCFREHLRSARRALLSSSNGNYRPSLELSQLPDFCREFCERNVNRAWDVPERASELVGAAHIYQSNFFAALEPALNKGCSVDKALLFHPAYQPRQESDGRKQR